MMRVKSLIKLPNKNPVTLRDFHQRRNKVAVLRRVGGLGDILMHRMMFDDMAKYGLEITWACPRKYWSLAKNHPAVSHLVESEGFSHKEYGMVYDTTTRCRVHESMHAPNCSDNRSDIWAASCGVRLETHDMNLPVTEEMIRVGKAKLGPGKTVVFVPVSSNMPQKDLSEDQICRTVSGLRQRGFIPVGLHTGRLPWFDRMVQTSDLEEWKSVLAAADCVVTVDTAAFHYAGGIGKPMVGIFSFTDGKVYGKYYKFILVQKHRDNGNWDCGPCFNSHTCSKEPGPRKPCVTELSAADILDGFDMMMGTKLPVVNV